MDKKHKQQRQKTPTSDELDDVTPRGASFDTEEGRAAQGMRPDIGRGGGDVAGRGPGEVEGAVGAADADNGGGAGAGIPDADTVDRSDGRVNKGKVEEDRAKIFPDAKTKRER